MASQAMNATLRFTQRTYSRKISHVLSGNTRSLSSTSNPATRASATRTAAFVTAHHGPAPSSSRILAGTRSYSNQSESRSSRGHEGVREVFEDQPTAQDPEAPNGRKDLAPDRFVGPSRTLFVGGLPFFCTEADIRAVFSEAGTVKNVRINGPKSHLNQAFAFVTMSSIPEAVAIVESAQEEPFVLEGRTLKVSYGRRKEFPPSNAIFFSNFNNGDLVALRQFLGPAARTVDNAWFTYDKSTNEFRPAGLIICRDVESATRILKECHLKPGPDGLPVVMRYAKRHLEQTPDEEGSRETQSKEGQQTEKQ